MAIAEISAAISSVQAASGILQGLNAASKGAAINDVKLTLGEKLLNTQSALSGALAAQTEATEKIRELEQEIVKLKDWSAERKRYEPVDVLVGTIAYMLKVGMEGGEPAHWLCANCVQQGRKSFLAYKDTKARKDNPHRLADWTCNSCNATVRVKSDLSPKAMGEARAAGQ